MTQDQVLAAIAAKGLFVNNLFQQWLYKGERMDALEGRRWACNVRTTYSDKPTKWYKMGYGNTITEALNAAYQNMLDEAEASAESEVVPRFIRTGEAAKKASMDDLL